MGAICQQNVYEKYIYTHCDPVAWAIGQLTMHLRVHYQLGPHDDLF